MLRTCEAALSVFTTVLARGLQSRLSLILGMPLPEMRCRFVGCGGAMSIPNDPIILLSYINTKLRDEFSSLEDLCRSLCVSRAEITDKLASVGYSYDEKTNRFR